MKYVLILLLIANAAYAGWRLNRQLYGGPSPPVPDTALRPLPQGVATLKLLSELDQSPEERSVSPSTSGTSVLAGDTRDVAAAAAEPVTSATDDVQQATASETASETRAEPVVQRDQTAPPLQCVTVGPFSSRAGLTAVTEKVAALAARTQTRSDTKRETRLFQVFLEPSESEQEARQRLEELKSKGIQDYLLIRKGEMRNAIQLGVFRSQQSVAKRLAELQSQGYKAVVVPKYEGQPRFWLDVAFDPERASPEQIAGEAPAGVKVSTLSCDRIADTGTGQ